MSTGAAQAGDLLVALALQVQAHVLKELDDARRELAAALPLRCAAFDVDAVSKQSHTPILMCKHRASHLRVMPKPSPYLGTSKVESPFMPHKIDSNWDIMELHLSKHDVMMTDSQNTSTRGLSHPERSTMR